MHVISKKLIGNVVLITGFLLTCFIPLISLLLEASTDVSKQEHRRLAAIPELPVTAAEFEDFPASFEEFYRDNFGFRNQLNTMYNGIKFRLGDASSPRVARGKDGWLYLNDTEMNDTMNDFRNVHVYAEWELEAFFELLEAKRVWLADQGIEYIFFVAPNKATIYPEKLPGHIRKMRDFSALDQLLAYSSRFPKLTFLDVRDSLRANKTEQDLVYYRTDTHWNDYGASIAQALILKVAASSLPQLRYREYTPAEFDKVPTEGGDLARMLGLTDHYEDFRYTRRDPFCSQSVPIHQQRPHFSTVCASGNYSALIFRDSFFTSLQPYFSEAFREVTYVWDYPDFKDYSYWIGQQKPQIVIEQWVERILPRLRYQPEFTRYIEQRSPPN